LWVTLDEGLVFELDGETIHPKINQQMFIPKNTKHRLSSTKNNARVLEISFGNFDEEDIVRYEDDHGRI